MSSRADLVKEGETIRAKLAKESPRLDAAIETALARARAVEGELEEARRSVGAASLAKSEVVSPLEGRLVQIDGELRATAPADVIERLRNWLDAQYAQLQHATPEQSFTFTKPDGIGTASVQRVYSTSQPSLGRAIEAVLAAQRALGDVALEASVEPACSRIQGRVQQALNEIKVERVEGPTIADRLIGMAAVAAAGLRG